MILALYTNTLNLPGITTPSTAAGLNFTVATKQLQPGHDARDM
jgi:hypothetical protein